MNDKRLDLTIKVSLAFLLATVVVFVVLSLALAGLADRSDCRDGRYFINDRPVYVDGEHLQCKRLKLGQ